MKFSLPNILHLLCLLLLIQACTTADPIPLPPAVDAGPQPTLDAAPISIDMDAMPEPIQDRGLIPDASPMDLGIPDYVNDDIPPDELPKPSEIAVIGGGDDTTVVWWRGGRLFMKRFLVFIDRDVDAGVPGIGPIDPDSVQIQAGETQELGFFPPYDGYLSGIKPPNQGGHHPGWLLMPNTAEMSWLAIDLDNPDMMPQTLGLFGSLRMGARSTGAQDADQILILGKTVPGASHENGFVVLGDGISSEPRQGPRNRPLPEAITTSGADWIFAYADGVCALVSGSVDGPTVELGTWPCGGGKGMKLVGRGAISSADPGFYAVGQTRGSLVAWDPRPGEHINPGNIAVPTPSQDAGIEPPNDGGVTDAAALDAQPDNALDAGLGDSSIDSGNGDLPDGSSNDASGESIATGTVSLGANDSALRWLNRIPDGHVALMEDGTSLIFERFDIRTLPISETSRLGVLSTSGGATFDILWDSEIGEPKSVRTTATDSVSPPRGGDQVCPGRVPEVCEHVDHDCDGYAYGYICCNFTFPFDDTPLNSTEPLEGDWFVAGGDEGPISAVRYPQQVELHNLSAGANSCLGCWPGATGLTGMAQTGAFFVMSGSITDQEDVPGTCSERCAIAEHLARPQQPDSNDAGVPADSDAALDAGIQEDLGPRDGMVAAEDALTDAGDSGQTDTDAEAEAPAILTPTLFWHLRPGVVLTTVAPCSAVQHLEAFRDGEGVTAQVFCLDGRYDYRYTQESLNIEPTFIPYSFGPAHWISPPVKRREAAEDVTYILAAAGGDFALHLFRITSASINIVETPALNMAVTVADRALPFRPSIADHIRPARIVDGKYVEVHMPERGWQRGVSRRWVRSAYFSAHDHLAITVAEELDPNADDFDVVRQSLALFAHDLQTTGNHWGRPLTVRSTAILAHSFHGVSIADFTERDNERTIWMGIGRNRSPVVLSGFGVRCRGATDF